MGSSSGTYMVTLKEKSNQLQWKIQKTKKQNKKFLLASLWSFAWFGTLNKSHHYSVSGGRLVENLSRKDCHAPNWRLPSVDASFYFGGWPRRPSEELLIHNHKPNLWPTPTIELMPFGNPLVCVGLAVIVLQRTSIPIHGWREINSEDIILCSSNLRWCGAWNSESCRIEFSYAWSTNSQLLSLMVP